MKVMGEEAKRIANIRFDRGIGDELVSESVFWEKLQKRKKTGL